MISSIPVLGFEESDVLNVKTPVKIMVEFYATKNVNETIRSLNDADTRFLITKTPTSWIFSTDDTDAYDISLDLDYGNVSIKQTLLVAVFSGGELVSQRYIELDTHFIRYNFQVITGESIRYPSTEEIVDGVIQQVRGELYDVTGSIDHALRVMDANDKIFGTLVTAQVGFDVLLVIIILGIYWRFDELKRNIKKRFSVFESVRKEVSKDIQPIIIDEKESKILQVISLIKNGTKASIACKKMGISPNTYYDYVGEVYKKRNGSKSDEEEGFSLRRLQQKIIVIPTWFKLYLIFMVLIIGDLIKIILEYNGLI